MADELRRFPGTWWHPGDNDDNARVGGVLTIDSEGRVKLETMSALIDGEIINGGVRRRVRRSIDEPVIIHGAADGQAITLLGCTPANGGKVSVMPVMTETQVFRADAAVVGCWLDSVEQEEFLAMRVEISHLTEWAGRSGISYDVSMPHPDDPLPPGVQRPPLHTADLTAVPTLAIDLPKEGVTARLTWVQSFDEGGDSTAWGRVHRIRESTHFEVRASTARAALNFQSEVRPMQNLLTLATQSPCAISTRRLMPREDVLHSGVELLFHGEDIEIRPDRRAHHFLFGLDDMGSDALEKWYELTRQIGRPIDVLFGLDYDSGGYYETQLFSVATAAEGFHAALCPKSTEIGRDEHFTVKRKVKDALSDVAPSLREWALNRLGYNRPGLTRRYTELTELADRTAVEELLGDPQVWAKWLVSTRNAFGHGRAAGTQGEGIPEEGFYRLADTTKHLLHLILMEQSGISAELQRRAVTDHWGYQARRFRDMVDEYKARA